MKSIFMIGDSIRVGAPGSPGYGGYVEELLKDKATVFQTESGRFAQYTLRYVHEWAEQLDREKVDVVYWNNGLWDVLRLNGDGPLTPLDIYLSFMERICKKLKSLFPNARIIFALTTPVIEEWTWEGFMRRNADIEQYNTEVEKMLKGYGVEISDLYSVAKEFGENNRCDWTHYDAEGSRLLAEAVVKDINI